MTEQQKSNVRDVLADVDIASRKWMDLVGAGGILVGEAKEKFRLPEED